MSVNLDNSRKPINTEERNKRIKNKARDELYPYYGATGQVGFIDDFLFDGTYILLGEDAAPFLDKNASKAYLIKGKTWVNNHAHIIQPFISLEYMMNSLNAIDYSSYVYGTTRLKLTQFDMNRILLPIPPIDEQKRIAEHIDSIVTLIEETFN